MNILITGAEGFIGKNLHHWLSNVWKEDTILTYDIGVSTNGKTLAELCRQADFVFHLAGVNRPIDPKEFEDGNAALTREIVNYCRQGKCPPIVLSSSAQAAQANPYGESKKAAEDVVFSYAKDTGSPVYVFRLPGVFGKWSRPNYNTVVATFCHNIANDLPVEIRDPEFELSLVYIDDVCRCFAGALAGQVEKDGGFCTVDPVHCISLGQLADMVRSFKSSRQTLNILDMSDPLTLKLYSTYLSYLPKFSYPLATHADERGAFAEFVKSPTSGQVSVNITKPGYTKGNHWHQTKVEKFFTVGGQGVIRLRKIDEQTIYEYHVSSNKLEVVDIPPGYTHTITNTGIEDLVTIIWVNEIFDPNNPDTFYLNVEEEDNA